MFDRYSKHVLRHPKAIIAVWLVALLVAVPFAAHVGDVLNYDMTSMGGFDSESSEGQGIVDEYFEGGLSTDTVLVVPYGSESELSRIEAGLLGSGSLTEKVAERYGDAVSLTVLGSYGSSDSGTGVFMVAFSFGSGVSAMDEVGNLRSVVGEAMASAGLG